MTNKAIYDNTPIDYVRVEDVPKYFKSIRKHKRIPQNKLVLESDMSIHQLQAVEIRVPKNIKLSDVEAYAKAIDKEIAIVFNEKKVLRKVEHEEALNGRNVQTEDQLESSQESME